MTTITVHNSAELKSALSTLSKTGGTIELVNDGSSYSLEMSNIGTASTAISIVAADPEDPPVFTSVTLNNFKNVTFDGVTFDASDIWVSRMIEINGGSGITFENSSFTGSADGYYAGKGTANIGGSFAYLRGTTDVTFENNTISNFANAFTVINSNGTQLLGNDISGITLDGIRLTGVQDTVIDGNYLHDFYGSDQNYNHSDMIQVFSHSSITTQLTENLVISNNILTTDTVASQTIFIGNEMKVDGAADYTNITITGNTIYNGHTHGIQVSGTDGLVITDNTLLWNTDAVMKSTGGSASSTSPSIKLSNDSNVVVANNIASGYSLGDADAYNNVTVSLTSTSANYVGNHFVNAVNAGNVDIRDLSLLADSSWVGIGSADSQPDSTGDGVTAILRQVVSIHEENQVTYDASLSYGASGTLDPETTTYLWTFDDGTTATGVAVTHVYAEAGLHNATLTVITEAGSDTISRSSEVKVDQLLDIDFESGVADDSSYATTMSVNGTAEIVESNDGSGYHLNGTNKIYIKGSQTSKLQNFTLAISAKLDESTDTGLLVHKHNGFMITVTKTGAARVILDMADGSQVTLTTADGLMKDTEWHRIAFSVQGGSGGLLTLYIDGVEVGSKALSGALKSTTYDLVLGNLWGASAQATIDDVTMLSSVRDADWAADDYADAFGLVSDADGGDAATDAGSAGGEDLATLQPLEPEATEDDGTTVYFADSASLPATLQAGLSSKTRIETPSVSPLEAADLLKLDFDSGIADASGHKAQLWKTTSGANLVTGADGTSALHLDGSNKVYITRDNSYLYRPDSFTLGISLKLDEAGDAGTFLHLYRGLEAKVMSDGSLSFFLQTSEGIREITTEKGLLSDDDWHRLVFTYDGTAGGDGLQIYVDGDLAGSVALGGTVNWGSSYHLVLGNTWSGSVHATVDDFEISSDSLDAAQVAADYDAFESAIAAAADPDNVGVSSDGTNVLGTSGDDVITGTDADELFFGREGADTLTGGAGADCFVFDRAVSDGNVDTITDFSADEGDQLLFDADLFGLSEGDTLAFTAGTAAADADAGFIYDQDSGQLWFDADGTGDQEKQLLAHLAPGTGLSAQDISLF